MLPELEQRNQEIVKTYINGATAEKVGKQFNLSYARVLEILKENNFHTRHRGKPDFTDRNKKIVELYAGGLNSIQIGKQFDLSGNRILEILRENNQKIRHSAPNKPDLVGQRFGRLLVLEEAPNLKKKISRWLCQCDCGNQTFVRTGTLRNGHTKSCGCLRVDTLIKTFTKHGLSKSTGLAPKYIMFHSAKSRAKKLDLPFNLELSDIIIPEYCPVFPEIKLKVNDVSRFDSPSLDRIIPELGYVKNNIMVISHKANSIKNSVTDPEDLMRVAIWLECELNNLKKKAT